MLTAAEERRARGIAFGVACDAMVGAMRGRSIRQRGELIEPLRLACERAGYALGGPVFDRAAEHLGLHYSRSWDCYVDRATLADAEGAYYGCRPGAWTGLLDAYVP